MSCDIWLWISAEMEMLTSDKACFVVEDGIDLNKENKISEISASKIVVSCVSYSKINSKTSSYISRRSRTMDGQRDIYEALYFYWKR
ncbi:hypothetical protein CXF94_00805 [Halomonas sp. Choline-3u-9]|nr:hypothetical protein CXF94_00805 [Halomonas sp. Choline-3u-9]